MEKHILGCIKGLLVSTTYTGDVLPWEVENSPARDFRLDSGQPWIGIRWQEPVLITKADLVCRLVSYLPTLNSLVSISQVAGPSRYNLCEPSYPLHTKQKCALLCPSAVEKMLGPGDIDIVVAEPGFISLPSVLTLQQVHLTRDSDTSVHV